MVRSQTTHQRRQGVALLVVITLMSLFAVVGLAFLLYSESQATSSRVWREAQDVRVSVIDWTNVINHALAQVIYDAPDDESGILSALRGHSLARTMYGWKSDGSDNWDTPPPAPPIPALNNPNRTPFNGTGRVSYPTGLGLNYDQIVNFTHFDTDPVVVDPERAAERASATAPLQSYIGGFNVPYSYPDRNNMFLSARRADGTILRPSYYVPGTSGAGRHEVLRPRPADHDAGFPPLSSDVAGNIGDVKNLLGAPGGNDSIWIDAGYSPFIIEDEGSSHPVKPLFAIYIEPLDNRVNLNTAGNRLGPIAAGQKHRSLSHQGWGPWEVNPFWVLPDSTTTSTGYEQLHNGRPDVAGRYGVDQPGARARSPYGAGSPEDRLAAVDFRGGVQRFYSQADFDAGLRGQAPNANQRIKPIGTTGNELLRPFPVYPAVSGSIWQNGNTDEFGDPQSVEHPAQFAPYFPGPLGAAPSDPNVNRAFAASEMFYLLATYGGYRPPLEEPQHSRLYQLIPGDIDTAGNRISRLITTISNDYDRPGAAPWVMDPSAVPYNLTPGTDLHPRASQAHIDYPTTLSDAIRDSATMPAGSDFIPGDGRSRLPALGKVDLGRKLAAYPTPTDGAYTVDHTDPAYVNATKDRLYLCRDIFDRLRKATGAADPATVALPPANDQAGDASFEALRYLAQLAVNIVDQIDEDDVVTAFNWYPGENLSDPNTRWIERIVTPDPSRPPPQTGWVYGTELPRLLLNEVYAEIENDPKDMGITGAGTGMEGMVKYIDKIPSNMAVTTDNPRASEDYHVNFWIELHNPFNAKPTDATYPSFPSDSDDGAARLRVEGPSGPYAAYRIVVRDLPRPDDTTNPNPLKQVWNTTGEPLPPMGFTSKIDLEVSSYEPEDATGVPASGLMGADQFIVKPSPADPTYRYDPKSWTASDGFFVIGPGARGNMQWTETGESFSRYAFPFNRFDSQPMMGDTDYEPVKPSLRLKQTGMTVEARRDGLTARLPEDTDLTMFFEETRPTVLLRRLANPYLPPNDPNVTTGSYTYDDTKPLNPYITVDYMEWLEINDAVLYSNMGPRGNDTMPTMRKAQDRVSFGKKQPYASLAVLDAMGFNNDESFIVAQDPSTTPPASLQPPKQTFFRHNGQGDTAPPVPGDTTLRVPFYSPKHLDRRPTNVMELLTVSAFKPHDLTQRFIDGRNATDQEVPKINGHLAPWGTPESRLYRALEFLGVRPRMAGLASGGRVPGKININALWTGGGSPDIEPFLAAVDPNELNYFREQEQIRDNTTGIFPKVINHRTDSAGGGAPTANDKPYWGMAAPHTSQATGPYPTATVEGINNTFLAPHSDGNLLFRPDPAQYDPAVQTDFFHNNAERLRADKTLEYEVLTKSYDQFTTRSNVFGVWITVGLFRVTDATTQPVRLGAEYVSPNVQRKRFFCVVDRTNLSIRNDAPTEQGAKPVFFPFLSADGNSPGFIEGNVNVTMIVPAAGRDPNDNNTLIGNCEGVPWSIGVGTRLWLDVGSLQEGNDDYLNRQEPVTVSAVNFDAGSRRATISFAITKGHAQGCAVSTALPGNPGPQPRFDYRAETYRQTVVPVSGFLN